MELVLEARRALAGRIRRTPTEFSRALSDVAKVPGAFFLLLNLSDDERRRGIVTCSAGNHGKAVAYVARELGLSAEIHVPRNVDESKYQGMLALGANVARSGFDGFDETEQLARAEAARTGRRFVTAFDDNLVLAANGGTLAAETIEDCLEARTFLLPVGGAGLAGGFAYYAKTALPESRILGCQHALSPALALSLEKGEAVLKLPPVETTAGGLEGGIGKTGFDVLKERVDGVALVTEDEIFEAVRFLLDKHQYLIEPSSAVTVAAILTGKAGRLDSPVAAVISGRNVALSTLQRILAA
jgi:threonine dehydratase